MASIAAAFVIVAYDAAIKPAYRMIAYDDRPPIDFLSARLERTELQPGEPIRMSFVYTKRPECHAPMAQPALVRFRVWLNEKDWLWLPYENRSYAPATDSNFPRETPFRSIPIPELKPGSYLFQWTATYLCAGASHPQTTESPKLPFRIIGSDR